MNYAAIGQDYRRKVADRTVMSVTATDKPIGRAQSERQPTSLIMVGFVFVAPP